VELIATHWSETVGVIQETANVEEAEQPNAYRGIRVVKDGVGSGLDSPKALFNRVLMLLMGFALPASMKSVQKRSWTFTDFNLSIITDELVWCTTFKNVIFKGIDKTACQS